ncbi:MAG: tetratricopeptide repeat protein [Myxococcota bacterium]
MLRPAFACFVLLLPLLSCGTSRSASSSGEGGGDVEEFIRLTGVGQMCDKLPAALQSSRDKASSIVSKQGLAWFDGWASTQFKPEKLREHVRQYVTDHTDATHLAASLQALRTPLFQRIQALGSDQSPQRIAQVQRALKNPTPVPPERQALIDRLVAADHTMALASEVGVGSARLLLIVRWAEQLGVSSYVRRAADQDAREIMGEQFANMEKVLPTVMRVTLEEISTADLERYVTFQESPDGKWLAETRNGAVVHMLAQLDHSLVQYLRNQPGVPWDTSGLRAALPRTTACTDVAACQEQCRNGAGAACLGAAAAVDTGLAGLPDPEKALPLYERACELGQATGCVRAGVARVEGRGAKAEPARARPLFERACQSGDAYGCANVARMMVVEAKTAQERAKGVELLRAQCHDDVVAGCTGVAWSLVEGVAVKADVPEALRVMERACNAGDLNGCRYLASAYHFGWDDVKQDHPRAMEIYIRACNSDDQTACNNYADMLENGQGSPQDIPKALEIYERACNRGEPMGCVSIGALYQEGKGVEKNHLKAAQMYERACRDGQRTGCMLLTKMRGSEDDAGEE